MPKNVVWTAVASTGAGIGTIVSAAVGSLTWTLGLGLVSVAAAMLSMRER
jgi:hypothetical protein